jgi:HTH-type transcriptional regulator/antitoxin MqsA
MSIETKDSPYTYRGKTTIIKGVTGKYCPQCNDCVLSLDESRRVSNAMLAFNREVNAAVIDASFIFEVRNKLKLTQAEANKLFGGGPNAFSRYETGKALPSKPLIQLLRLLDHRPELLEEIGS